MSTDRSITMAPCRSVEASIEVPGDKSISHRALLVAALAEGQTPISGLSPSLDVAATRRGIEQLGARTGTVNDESQVDSESFKPSSNPQDFHILVSAPGWDALREPEETIDVANSGTTIRILLGILAGSRTRATLTGDASILRRPMGRVVQPLRAMGARIDGADGGEHAPLTVAGRELTGVDHRLPVASAQVKSALIFAGLRATGTTTIAEPGPSRDHTERMLAYLGAPLEKSGDRLIVKSTKLRSASLTVPGDLSAAAFFLVAAAILPGSQVTVRGVGINPTRDGILDVLRGFGARVTVANLAERCGEPVGDVTVGSADRRPVEVRGPLTVRALDELPLVALLGATAEGPTVVSDAAELRVKESDRIAAICAGLRAMGADIQPTPDGFVVTGPARLYGARVDGAGDHRIAMTLAIAALAAEGPTTIAGWETVPVSHPGFQRDLAGILVP